MNLSRVSKKAPHADGRMTLLAIHENKISEFENYYKTQPEKEILLEQLKRSLKSQRDPYSNGVHLLKKQIAELEDVLVEMSNKTEYNEYLMKSANYLKEYNNDHTTSQKSSQKSLITNQKSLITAENLDDEFELDLEEFDEDFSEMTSNKGQISKNFMQDCLGSGANLIPTKPPTNNTLYCTECCQDKVINHREALATCLGCGLTETYQDTELATEFSEEIEVLSPFSYKRINHFKEWISMMLARESASPPEEVIDLLLLELKKDRIKKVEDVTPKRIRAYLKRLGLNKQYEHIPAIIYKICGVAPPVISRELENKLINMFEEIQIPFQRHRPKLRKNFLSYSYCLNKLTGLLGQYYLQESFPLLKSREKLYEQDKLFELICKDLGWEFTASI